MKKLLLSSFIIFLSMNILAHDSEISRLNEIEKLVFKFDQKPALFKISSKTCDAELISFWLSTSAMGKHYTNKGIRSNFNKIVYPHICEELKRDPKINIAFIKMVPSIFVENIDPKLVSNYDELALTAVKESSYSNFFYVKPEELSNPEVYDNIAVYSVGKHSVNIDHVKPELLSSTEVYEKLAETAVKAWGRRLKYVKPEHLNNYDELVKLAMNDDIEYVEEASTSGVYNLEKTKRRDLLNYIKSFRCNLLEITIFKCKYKPKERAAVDQWLKDYDEYEKEQEVN